MFTGIVTAVGEVARVEDRDALRRLTVTAPDAWIEGIRPGDSISVDGACLTPVEVEQGRFTVEAVRSTLDRTVVGSYAPGRRVNLEKALRVGDRLDGHWVQGHVDGLARFDGLREVGETRFLRFVLPPDVWATTILHGSIALNGVSLTVNALDEPDGCEVAIIPHTWTGTNLSTLQAGDPVNVEGDLMGKYAQKILDPRGGTMPSRDSGDRATRES